MNTTRYEGRHRQPARHATHPIRALTVLVALLGALLAVPALTATAAHASVRAPAVTARAAPETLGGRILDTARTRAGDWYVWGAAGPSTFDCSGLVVWAARQHGITLPRTTYAMPSSPHLYRVYAPQRGDLAFFAGFSHVEIVTAWYHQTFGAHKSGTQVGYARYYPPGWAPVAWYRFR